MGQLTLLLLFLGYQRFSRHFSFIAVMFVVTTISEGSVVVHVEDPPLEVTDLLNLPGNAIGGINIDVDGDTTPDINLAWIGLSVNSTSAYSGIATGPRVPGSSTIILGSLNVIQVGQDNNEYPVVSRFTSNDSIGPAFAASLSGTGDFYELVYESFFDGIFGGAFCNEDYENERGYIGFTFLIGANRHWGWVDVEMDFGFDGGTAIGALLVHDWGYESTPDAAITPREIPVCQFTIE